MMRAAQYSRYGGPGVIRLGSTPVPSPGPGKVLVSVHGTSVNPIECAVRRGSFALATGFAFPRGVGLDFAGQVAAVGEGFTGFAVGDRVWGFLGGLPSGPSGAAAEFVVAHSDRVSLAPSDLDLADAAGLPLAGATALVALRRHLRVTAGTRLLVRGAAGGVGTAAVQLAKAMGAHVTVMAGADSLQFLRELGAEAALDYRAHGPDQLGRFDAILDLTGVRLLAYRTLLARRGRMVTTAIGSVVPIVLSTIHGTKRIRTIAIRPTAKVLTDLAGYVTRGELRPVTGRVFPLTDVATAQATLEAGGVTGKVLISVLE